MANKNKGNNSEAAKLAKYNKQKSDVSFCEKIKFD